MKQLSTVEGTVGFVLTRNKDTINSITNRNELERYITERLMEEAPRNKESLKFIQRMKTARTLERLQSMVYYEILAGDGLKVI